MAGNPARGPAFSGLGRLERRLLRRFTAPHDEDAPRRSDRRSCHGKLPVGGQKELKVLQVAQ
jgi:hypothetical protein